MAAGGASLPRSSRIIPKDGCGCPLWPNQIQTFSLSTLAFFRFDVMICDERKDSPGFSPIGCLRSL